MYKVRVDNLFSMNQIMQTANDIFDWQDRGFHLNLEFGIILVHTETGGYRYFKLFSNQEQKFEITD